MLDVYKRDVFGLGGKKEHAYSKFLGATIFSSSARTSESSDLSTTKIIVLKFRVFIY